MMQCPIWIILNMNHILYVHIIYGGTMLETPACVFLIQYTYIMWLAFLVFENRYIITFERLHSKKSGQSKVRNILRVENLEKFSSLWLKIGQKRGQVSKKWHKIKILSRYGGFKQILLFDLLISPYNEPHIWITYRYASS